MATVPPSNPPRRWSKRSALLLVSSLSASALVLVLSVVGFARSVGFVMHAADALGELGQSAPEHASPERIAVPPANPAGSVTETSASPSAAIASDANPSAPPVALASPASTSPSAAASDGAAPASEAQAGPLAGVAGVSGSGGADAGGGAGGTGGVAGAAPTFWENVVQSVLAMVGQSAVQMCGPNTCNTGQVCCNASCGICVAPGASCDKTECAGAARAPTAVRCGAGQCNDGQVCCNASCGICAAPGESCSEETCP